MVEANLIPDTFIVLQDNSEGHTILTKRWYQANKDEINAKIFSRMEAERFTRKEEDS
jgi:hypothetical protein